MSDGERPGDDTAQTAGIVVSSSPRSIAAVRRYAVDTCHALGWGAAADLVALLVSEVATHAVLHAYGPQIGVRVLVRGPRLRVVVEGSPVLPAPRRARTAQQDACSLALVEALADRWGVETRTDGTSSWFEVSG